MTELKKGGSWFGNMNWDTRSRKNIRWHPSVSQGIILEPPKSLLQKPIITLGTRESLLNCKSWTKEERRMKDPENRRSLQEQARAQGVLLNKEYLALAKVLERNWGT